MFEDSNKLLAMRKIEDSLDSNKCMRRSEQIGDGLAKQRRGGQTRNRKEGKRQKEGTETGTGRGKRGEKTKTKKNLPWWTNVRQSNR
jgi:hypothetical protein